MALFIALGGTGYALTSAGGSSQSAIHACVNNKTGAVRIVRGPRACHRSRRGYPGERSVAWNQTGPVGRTGQVGPTGHIGPSDAYYTTSTQLNYAPIQDGGVSVTVPPGNYTATGGCTALYEAAPGTSLAFSIGIAEVNTGPPSVPASPNSYSAEASVPNTGGLTIDGHGDIQYGSAALSDTGAFSLPNGGEISQSCSNDVTGGGVTLFHLTATRVGTLHATTAPPP
jgi:hypothetical protein